MWLWPCFEGFCKALGCSTDFIILWKQLEFQNDGIFKEQQLHKLFFPLHLSWSDITVYLLCNMDIHSIKANTSYYATKVQYNSFQIDKMIEILIVSGG